MKIISLTLKWTFGIFCVIYGIIAFFSSIITGLLFFFLGLFVMPFFYDLLSSKTRLKLPSLAKWTIVIIWLTIGIFSISRITESNNKEADIIMAKAEVFIENNELDSAKVYINKAKKQYSFSSRSKAKKLLQEIETFNSEELVEETLATLTDDEFKKLKNDSLKKEYFSQNYLNKQFISLMKAKLKDRKTIIKKVAERKKQEEIAIKAEIERKKQEELNKNRKKIIEEQFNADGSHFELAWLIKKNLRNPDSYEHIETRFRDDGSSIYVTTKYRAENGFGGMAIETCVARVDLKGNVIEIISQN